MNDSSSGTKKTNRQELVEKPEKQPIDWLEKEQANNTALLSAYYAFSMSVRACQLW
jgi:hypothetical protein